MTIDTTQTQFGHTRVSSLGQGLVLSLRSSLHCARTSCFLILDFRATISTAQTGRPKKGQNSLSHKLQHDLVVDLDIVKPRSKQPAQKASRQYSQSRQATTMSTLLMPPHHHHHHHPHPFLSRDPSTRSLNLDDLLGLGDDNDDCYSVNSQSSHGANDLSFHQSKELLGKLHSTSSSSLSSPTGVACSSSSTAFNATNCKRNKSKILSRAMMDVSALSLGSSYGDLIFEDEDNDDQSDIDVMAMIWSGDAPTNREQRYSSPTSPVKRSVSFDDSAFLRSSSSSLRAPPLTSSPTSKKRRKPRRHYQHQPRRPGSAPASRDGRVSTATGMKAVGCDRWSVGPSNGRDSPPTSPRKPTRCLD